MSIGRKRQKQQTMNDTQTDVAPINLDSLWIIGPRAKGSVRNNAYHGNFVPQIPIDFIRRFTKEDDIVLDMFTGSGTALFECIPLHRRYIGFDINETIVADVLQSAKTFPRESYRLNICDICDENRVRTYISSNLNDFSSDKVDLVFSHPPYLDIINFTDHDCDLSHIGDLPMFTSQYLKAVENIWTFLKKGGYFVLVIGDIYKKGEVIPLGFTLMSALRRTFKCQLKGIIVKDIVGNRAKIGKEALWRYRAMKWGTYIFKHEYIFVFKKQ